MLRRIATCHKCKCMVFTDSGKAPVKNPDYLEKEYQYECPKCGYISTTLKGLTTGLFFFSEKLNKFFSEFWERYVKKELKNRSHCPKCKSTDLVVYQDDMTPLFHIVFWTCKGCKTKIRDEEFGIWCRTNRLGSYPHLNMIKFWLKQREFVDSDCQFRLWGE